MKPIFYVILLLITFTYSCDKNVKDIRINKLEIENQKLNDSIKDLHKILQISSKLGMEITNPYKTKDSTYFLTGKFYTYIETEPDNVYILKGDKKIKILENQTVSEFVFKYKPQFPSDSIIKIQVEIPQKDQYPIIYESMFYFEN